MYELTVKGIVLEHMFASRCRTTRDVAPGRGERGAGCRKPDTASRPRAAAGGRPRRWCAGMLAAGAWVPRHAREAPRDCVRARAGALAPAAARQWRDPA